LYKVYWTENTGAVNGQEFEDLGTALNFTQELRNTTPSRFITMMGEDPNCTSLSGASSMKIEDYHWKKRRS
jgi:hypothetical protein